MSQAVVYKTRPNHEHKAAKEIEQRGINAVVPWDDSGKRKRVTAPGYVFAGRELRAAFLKHVQHRVGFVRVDTLANLYVMKPKPSREENPYSVGQQVLYGEVPAKVIDVRGRACIVAWVMCGKQHSQSIHYTQLRPG